MNNDLLTALRNAFSTAAYKTFVIDAYEMVGEGYSLDTFKAELWELHRAGKIFLTRCDMPRHFGPEKCAASAIDTGFSTFHWFQLS
ncbi:hypothetical protein [Myxococcus phage Mx1]|nr:hypothetical protein [Myxococcus phage Mx1]